MLEIIYHYAEAFFQVLELEPMVGEILDITIADPAEYEKTVKQKCKDHEALLDAPMAWYMEGKKAIIVIKDDTFGENTDERYGLECLYSYLAEIYYTFSGLFEEIRQTAVRNVFRKKATTGYAVWKEFFCTFLANCAIAGVFEELGRDDYTPERRRQMGLKLLKKTLADNEKKSKMSVILYCTSKIATTEDNGPYIIDLKVCAPDNETAEALQTFYGVLTRADEAELTAKFLDTLGKTYLALQEKVEGK